MHEELQDLMGKGVGIVRTEQEIKAALDELEKLVGIVRTGKELEEGIDRLEALKKKVANVKADGASQYNPGWHEALSLRSLMTLAEMVARAALLREESRGAHTRIDFEGERDEWLRYNVVSRRGADGKLDVRKVERKAPPNHLAEIANATLEDLEAGRVGADAPED